MHFTVIFYVILVVGQLLAREPMSPAWASIRVLAWLSAAAAAGAAVLTWANVQTFELVLELRTVKYMTNGAIIMAGAAALFVVVALARTYTAASRPALGGALLLVALSSMAASLALRGPSLLTPLESHPLAVTLDTAAPPSGSSGRVTILAVDAGSLDLIVNAAAEGRLPNFGRILDSGAVMRLATLHPTSAEAVWSAVATGKLPQKNGVRSAGIFRLSGGSEPVQLLPEHCFASGLMQFGFLTEQPYTAAALRTRTLWSILSTLGIPVGVVNWPLSYPAPVVRGYLVSDLYARVATMPSGIDDPAMFYPPDLQSETWPVVQEVDGQPALPSAVEASLDDRRMLPARLDLLNDRLAQKLTESFPPQVAVVRYQSLDGAGHYFLRYATPSEFGDVSEEERQKFGGVLEGHYAIIDEAIGRAIKTLGPNDLLLVVSAYGMEPLGTGKRLIERIFGDPDISGTHDGAPDGFLMAYGASVAATRLQRRASVVDLVPTVLYFLGLPIGRDMDGYARTDLFQPGFTEERPITFIPTYDR